MASSTSDNNEIQSSEELDDEVLRRSRIIRNLSESTDNSTPDPINIDVPALNMQTTAVVATEVTDQSSELQCSSKTVHEENERPSKKPKLDETIDEDGSLCVICYEIWGQTGEHRIASLKCGHLFGHKCILRWLSENKVCPSCKSKATKKDIRFIYANKLSAIDNGELTRLQNELESIKTENMNMQIEHTSVLCKLHLVNAEIDRYKTKIKELTSLPISSIKPEPIVKNFYLKFVDSYMVCPQGSCRVMDYLASKSSIVASMKSPNNLFPGFGVKQFKSDTHAALGYIPLHTKAIRDLRFNQANARLLSVSLDKTFSIANIHSSESNKKQICDDMLWCCCWDATNPNLFYVGGQQGSVKLFDSRYITETPVVNHIIDGDMSPVVSIISIPALPGSAMPHGGFIACKLNSLWAFETSNASCVKSQLPVEGPFVAMTYSEEDRHLLISARPNSREPFARHIICNLRRDTFLTCDRIHTFTSGKMQKQLARSCFLTRNGTNYVATPNDNVVQLWNSETGFPVTLGKTSGTIIDLLSLQNQEGTHLLALAEKKLNAFRVIDS